MKTPAPLKYSVGIDCSKEELETAMILFTTDQRCTIKCTRTFQNVPNGFTALDRWIKQNAKFEIPVHIAIEATGNFHENAVLFLYNQDYHVSVVLPSMSKRYMQSLGLKSKNDSIDAKGLARMGAEQRLKKWEPFSKSIYELRSLTRYYEQITQTRISLNNQLFSVEYNMFQTNIVKAKLKELIDAIDGQKEEVISKIQMLISEDPALKERMDKIMRIRGLGLLSIATIIAETNGFALFENARQLTSYAGYDVVENQSGKRNGKTRISKKGNSHIRRMMYMPALGVVKYGEPHFVQIYERIYDRTKIKMKAYVAIQRKLLCLIYTLWENNLEYNPDYEKELSSGNEESNASLPPKKKVGKPRGLPTQNGLP